MTDLLKKYLSEDRSVRIQAVRLHETWLQAQVNHQHPPAVTRLLGELVAASTLLAANIKFDGSLVLQIQGDGPLALLVVECRSDLSLRATVKVREGQSIPDNGTMQSLLNANGNGRFMVVLDPQRKVPGQQAYQGIVPLEGETVAEALGHYMKASEQLDTQCGLPPTSSMPPACWSSACPTMAAPPRATRPKAGAAPHTWPPRCSRPNCWRPTPTRSSTDCTGKSP